jgi:hypothetical protein
MARVLEELQADSGTSARYFITLRTVRDATEEDAEAVSPVRVVLVVLVAGVLLTFVVVSVGDALRQAGRSVKESARFTVGV